MSKSRELSRLYEEIKECTGCRLSSVRGNLVFGEGNPEAKVMFIGEGPGKREDEQGRPFVGPAGELLSAIIEQGMHLKREDVFIANIVKCRPTVDLKGTRDRPPEKDEVAACVWILDRQIEIIRPQVIITLGNPATKYILKTTKGITLMRGNFGEYKGIKVMPTYHPSYLLRSGGMNSAKKQDVWEDVKKVLDYLGMTIPSKS